MQRLAALCSAVVLAGCAFSQSESEAPSFDHADPFHSAFGSLNAIYTENPFVEIPTAAGNGIGWLAFIIVWGTSAVIEDATRDDERHPVTRSVMAGGGYFGGAIVGTPFLGLYWGLYRWWWKAFFEKATPASGG